MLRGNDLLDSPSSYRVLIASEIAWVTFGRFVVRYSFSISAI